jgi:PmbA protein
MAKDDLLTLARSAVALARGKGAQEAAVRAARTREVETEWRDGKLEKVHEATSRSLEFQLYVDGRFAEMSTSDLRPEALATFVSESVALTRSLEKDPFRSLPDPKLYADRPAGDLAIEDAAYDAVTPDVRRRFVRELEEGARAVKESAAILSVTTSFTDSLEESARVASNGFEGSHRGTSYWVGASVSVKDADGRRPSDGTWAGARFFADLPAAPPLGKASAERAVGRLGAKKGDSAVMTMVLENRAGGRLLWTLLSPLLGRSLQQKRSFFEGKLGKPFASPQLTVTDEPLLPKGFGSRHFDAEGISAKARPVFSEGVLSTFFLDTYYAKKLGLAPTTGRPSNLAFPAGTKGRDALIADAKEGIYVTGFLGGNSNGTTGDFSLGIQGFRIRGGKLAEPVSEMNIAGNHLEFWKRLAAVGNDPYPYSTSRTPTLVFDGVQFAGV